MFRQDTNQYVNLIHYTPTHDRAHLCVFFPRFYVFCALLYLRAPWAEPLRPPEHPDDIYILELKGQSVLFTVFLGGFPGTILGLFHTSRVYLGRNTHKKVAKMTLGNGGRVGGCARFIFIITSL